MHLGHNTLHHSELALMTSESSIATRYSGASGQPLARVRELKMFQIEVELVWQNLRADVGSITK